MTTIEFFHRIGRHARGRDFTKLSLSETTDLLEASNAALNRLYGSLPTYFKEMTIGFILPPPRQINVTVARGSDLLSSSVFAPAEIGRSVVLGGDPNWNQVLGTQNLANPYNGESGDVQGYVYGDAFWSERYPFDRIIGNPRFLQPGAIPLMRSELTRSSYASLFYQTIGRPQAFWTQSLGNSQGNEPLICMRFAPAPDIAYTMSVRIAFWAMRLTLADFTAANTLPVPDQFIETCLIPLALKALMATPVWDDTRKDEDRIDKGAAEAIAFLKNQPGQVGSPDNRIFTPIGF
jgi:hypothetical protein